MRLAIAFPIRECLVEVLLLGEIEGGLVDIRRLERPKAESDMKKRKKYQVRGERQENSD